MRVKLANVSVELNNRYAELEILCQDYLTNEKPVTTLSVTQEEIEEERTKQADIFTDGYLETVCLYRKLALVLLQYDVFLLHASVVEVDGEGYAFLARSGTGKTTQTQLWRKYFGDRARVINGDKPLIRVMPEGTFTAYGTPWCGKEGMGCNASVPLKAMFLLERSTIPSCEPVSQEYSIDRLFHQLLMPEKPDQMIQLLDMVDKLVGNVPCYLLRCDMTERSVLAAYKAVNK